jgi:hypothetical protein
MKKILIPSCMVLIAYFGSCKPDEPAERELLIAKYRVTFNFKWNAQDFPTDYPSNAHFSKLIGWSHKPSSEFFKVGSIASEGIKNMAEVGSTEKLTDEFTTKIEANEGLKNIIGNGLGSGVGELSVTLDVNEKFSSITLATMLAPSPDWYVAIINQNLLENGEFIDEKTVDALTYDAGTDSGENFTSSNAPIVPKVPISVINTPPIGNGKTIATVKFEKL